MNQRDQENKSVNPEEVKELRLDELEKVSGGGGGNYEVPLPKNEEKDR